MARPRIVAQVLELLWGIQGGYYGVSEELEGIPDEGFLVDGFNHRRSTGEVWLGKKHGRSPLFKMDQVADVGNVGEKPWIKLNTNRYIVFRRP